MCYTDFITGKCVLGILLCFECLMTPLPMIKSLYRIITIIIYCFIRSYIWEWNNRNQNLHFVHCNTLIIVVLPIFVLYLNNALLDIIKFNLLL